MFTKKKSSEYNYFELNIKNYEIAIILYPLKTVLLTKKVY